MKKTLAAVAVLGAFAGSALAADVQLYGIVDTGVRYLHTDLDVADPNYDAKDTFSMESGMASGSRWGLKGTEDLGNGLKVGFILEDGFTSDDGAEKGEMFDRESSLFIEGSFGKFAMGRIGSINGGVSSWAKHGVMSAFGTSWGDYSAQADNIFGGAGQWDNMIAYETPDFAGFKVFAQYGMGSNGNENESSSDRYYAIGASYANGPLSLYLAVDSINYQTAKVTLPDGVNMNIDDIEDSLSIRFGGNYDFEVAKLFAGVAYFDEARLSSFNGPAENFTGKNASWVKIKGWSIGVSGSIPVAGGNILVGAGYMDAEGADSMKNQNVENAEISRWVVSAGYDYPFSKRTDVYGVFTYMQDSVEKIDKVADADPNVYGVMVGLRHKF